MAQPTNTFDKYDAVGVREDLDDKITNVNPEETPVYSSIGRKKIANTFFEWQRDSFASPDKDNALIDGDTFSAAALTATERIGNHAQIFHKQLTVSRRADIVDKAGRESETRYQIAKGFVEMKRHVEASICSNNAAVAGNSSTASKSGGLGVFIYTAASHGAGGSTASHTSGAPTTAPTAGTNRTWTEQMVKDVLKTAVTNSGAVPRMMVVTPSHKQTFSGFSGIAANRFNLSARKGQGVVVGGADVYLSDFGEISVVPNYVMATSSPNNVWLINTDYVKWGTLDGFRSEKQGRNADGTSYMLTYDGGLMVQNEKACAKVADLTA